MPKADHLSPAAIELLREPQIGHFVTVMADGSPHVTPVYVDVTDDGGTIIINSVEGRQKSKNAELGTEVALSVVDKNKDFRWVGVRGIVIGRIHEGANEHADKLAKKYMGVDVYPNHRSDEQRVLILVKPHHVLGWV